MSIKLNISDVDPVTNSLCERYWALDENGRFAESASDLSLPDGVDVEGLSRHVSLFCAALDDERFCTVCGDRRLYDDRDDYLKSLADSSEWFCETCREMATRESGDAFFKKIADKRSRIRTKFGGSTTPEIWPDEDLSFSHAVGLLALLRHGGNGTSDRIHPLATSEGQFAPTQELAVEVLRDLYESRLIAVDPESATDSFADDVSTFYVHKVGWLTPAFEVIDQVDLLADVEQLFELTERPQSWYDDMTRFWLQVALHECLSHLEMCMSQHGIAFKATHDLRRAAEALLGHLPPAQVFTYLQDEVEELIRVYPRKALHQQDAMNLLTDPICDFGESLSEWAWVDLARGIAKSPRFESRPASALSSVLSQKALKLGSDLINFIPGPIAQGPVAVPRTFGAADMSTMSA